MAVNNLRINNDQYLRVLQVNLNKSLPASLHLSKLANERHWDVLLIQEPKTYAENVLGFQGMKICSKGSQPKSAVIINTTLNKNISVLHHRNISDQNITIVTLTMSNFAVTVVSAYHPGKPRHNHSNTEDIRKLDQAISTFPNSHILFGIDSNAYAPEWGEYEVDGRGEELAEFIASSSLYILNEGNTPTYRHETQNNESFIDITLCNGSLSPLINNWEVLREANLTDHRYIVYSINMATTPINRQTYARRYNETRADWTKFTELLTAYKPLLSGQIELCETATDVENCTTEYMNWITRIAKRTIPYTRPFSGSNKWWNPTLTALRRETRRLRNRLSGRPADYEYRLSLFKEAERRYKKAIKDAKEKSFRDFCTESTEADPWGKVYNMLKTKSKKDTTLKPIRKDNGEYTSSEIETLTILMEKHFPNDDPQADTVADNQLRQEMDEAPNTADDILFSECEVRNCIWRMGLRRTPGSDLITALILRKIHETLHSELTLLFNKCLEIGCFPRAFKEADVKFIEKKDSDTIETYKALRPICLITTHGKALDSLMISRIQWHLYTTNNMSRLQYGFVPQKSTTDAILNATRLITQYRNKGWCVLVISLDIEDAFNSAKWHHILSALKKRQCPSNLYRLATSYFSARSVRVTTQASSVTRLASQGCAQGSPSGPIFWNILYDDLLHLEFPEHVYTQTYADDAVIIACGANVRTAERRATEALTTLVDWSNTIRLRFNPSKTQILCVGKGSECVNPPRVTMCGQTLRVTKEIKYLGVIIDYQLSFTSHIRDVTTRAQNAIARFSRLARNQWGIGPKAMTIIWKCAIQPAITYAAPVWAGKVHVDYNVKRLRTTQRKALLRATRAYNTTPHTALWTICGDMPLDLRIEELAANYYIRLAQVPLAEHFRPPLLDAVQMDEIRRDPDFFRQQHPGIRTIFARPRNQSILNGRQVVREEAIRRWQRIWDNSLTGRLTHRFLPDLHARMTNRHFQTDHILTQYLTRHGDFNAYLCEFRRKETNQCPECQTNDDSTHRLINCPLYIALRDQLRQRTNTDCASIEELATLITAEDSWNHLVSYIHSIQSIACDRNITQNARQNT